ncbi:MAG TPA: hypothetical protein VHB30_08240 [Solirubrobacteraceae bacterium]|jgi:hypothetical protein|nr:hypothetical protein [Solirubrobacteraceae bacterium]
MTPDPPQTQTDAPAGSAGEQDDARECLACRATGRVISGLGGVQAEIECPWCEGSGRFIPGHDAQARWREGDGGERGEAA